MIAFGPFVLDLEAHRLLRDGNEVKLRHRALHVLRVLASRTGQNITFEQLIAEAWDGTHVARHTVDITVGDARKALSDCGTWITCKRGEYRLMVPQSDALIALGRHVSAQNTRDGILHGLDRFTEAAALAPSDHRAFVGQCDCHLSLLSLALADGVTAWRHFRSAHARAAQLVRPTTLRADYAYALFLSQRKIDEAEIQLRQVLVETPAEPVICVRMMAVQAARGELDAALAWALRARAAAPLLAMSSAAVLAAHVWRREFAVAVAVGRDAVRLHPHFLPARLFYGMALQCSGRLCEALDQYRIAAALAPDVPWTRALEAHCLIRSGESRAADAIFDELLERQRREYVDAAALAHLRMARGEMTHALADLRQAMDEMNGRWYLLGCDPLLDDLRADRGFRRVWEHRFAHHRKQMQT